MDFNAKENKRSRNAYMVQKNGNTFLGIPCYGQQILSGISFVLVVGAIWFISKKIKKEKVIVQ